MGEGTDSGITLERGEGFIAEVTFTHMAFRRKQEAREQTRVMTNEKTQTWWLPTRGSKVKHDATMGVLLTEA